jgi:RNA polymerase-binding transcription factor DksA
MGKSMGKKRQAAKLSAKQLEHYRELLLEKLQEIIGDMGSMEESVFSGSGELSSMPVHLADIGTDSYEQEFSLGLMAEEKKLLSEILQALERIKKKTYGICEGLGVLIEANRLEAIPWTRYSLEYARMLESGKTYDLKNIKLRPIDIQRDDEIDDEDEQEMDDQDEELTTDDMELDGQMLSLDELENEQDEDDDEEDDDNLKRRRNSA